MAESATADMAYFHTLNARPFFFPLDHSDRDPRLPRISCRLLSLPLEIRHRIYELAFRENRVAVTAANGCYCASDASGPYQPDHRWLLTEVTGAVRQDAQSAFIKVAMWELHCLNAFNLFLKRIATLGALKHVRHIRINVFETSRDQLDIPIEQLPSLRSVTFAPWQKSWTIDVSDQEGSNALSDASIIEKVYKVLGHKTGYKPVRSLITSPRDFKIYFVFPIRYFLPGPHTELRPRRWQIKVWRADFDTNTIDRSWQEIHLVREATLD